MSDTKRSNSDVPQPTDVDVAIIGAGISGINTAYYIETQAPKGTSYTILEARNTFGGTWDLFRYPGVRSDSDKNTFGFTWSPWEKESRMVSGNEMLEYMYTSAQKYGIEKHFKFNHRVVSANWDSSTSQWVLSINVTSGDGDSEKSKSTNIRCNFIVMGTGYYDYDQPLQTEIPGLENFGGTVIHPQFWPEKFDYTNKDMVIIGSGATAVTLVPSVAEKVKHVTMLQRSPTYIASLPMKADDPLSRFLRLLPTTLAAPISRLRSAALGVFFVYFCRFFPDRARRTLRELTIKQLPPNISWDPHFNPRYNPWEQRLCACPDGDFYAALRSGKADVVTDVIKNITSDSIQLASGETLKPDTIVTATGLKLKIAGGIQVYVDGKRMEPSEKFIWKGVMIQDVPNLAFIIGYVNASWTLGADVAALILIRVLRQLKARGVSSATPYVEPDQKMEEQPLFKMSSTYFRGSEKLFPKCGEGQWMSRVNYLVDYIRAWWGDVSTGLRFK